MNSYYMDFKCKHFKSTNGITKQDMDPKNNTFDKLPFNIALIFPAVNFMVTYETKSLLMNKLG